MQHQILYKSNSSTADDIQKHLSAVDTDFAIKLSDRVDIHEYAHKLSIKSERIEAWKEDSLVGLLAYYNNQTTNSAYISNISVTKEFRSSGIASCLLEKLKEYIANHGITKITLEADKSLLDFYKKNDFTMGKQLTNNSYEMEYYSSNKKILVSICCLVYNHEPYLRDCFDGFVKQKTTFPIEILVHDDASTDHSADIIREYTAKYPDLFKPIYQTENQHSKGFKISFKYQYPRAQGKYIALCEGDDYWTDPGKLQEQVVWLENHPDYTMCCSDAVIESPDGILDWHRYENDCDIPVKDMIMGGGGFVQTATIVYRKGLLKNYPDVCKTCYVGDYPLQIWSVLNGKVRFFARKLATYRFGTAESWTQKLQQASHEYHLKHTKSVIEMLGFLNLFSNKKYQAAFSHVQTECILDLHNVYKIDRKIIEKEFKSFINSLPFNKKATLFFKFFQNTPVLFVFTFFLKYLNQLVLYIKKPLYLFDTWAAKGRLNWMPDKWYLSLMYRSKMGYWMNWKNPQTFNEKLQWLKIYNRNPLYTKLVDKYEVREYITKKIGKNYLIPLLGVWNNVNEIDFNRLPNQFVLKCTHDSNSVIICRNKDEFDFDKAKKKIHACLSRNFYYVAREWPYKKVKPRIIAEKYLESEEQKNIYDYKFFCFNGAPKFMYISKDHDIHPTTDFFDMEFNKLPMRMRDPNSNGSIPKPPKFEKMKELASILSQGIPHVRVDFYCIQGKIYFGEMTFYHNAGFSPLEPKEINKKIGSLFS